MATHRGASVVDCLRKEVVEESLVGEVDCALSVLVRLRLRVALGDMLS